MFTGLISEIGTIQSVSKSSRGFSLTILCPKSRQRLKAGDSIAINGVCLTATKLTDSGFTADLSNETVSRTTLKDIANNTAVNLELPLKADGRLDGHFVQGHVDGVATVGSIIKNPDSWTVEFHLERDLKQFIVEKGSVAIDGISLTIAALTEKGFTVSVIPQTISATTIGQFSTGKNVNIETDILAKYIRKFVKNDKPDRSLLSEEFLRNHGFD